MIPVSPDLDPFTQFIIKTYTMNKQIHEKVYRYFLERWTYGKDVLQRDTTHAFNKKRVRYVKEERYPQLKLHSKLHSKDWLMIIGEILLFAFIIPVMWLDEYIDLRPFLPGMSISDRSQEYIIETSLILIIAVSVITATTIVLRKIRRIEHFLRVCAWCRKVWVDGKWASFEEYALREHSLRSSHGICDKCVIRLDEKKKEKDDKAPHIKIPPAGDRKKDKPIH
jgi:hypothetical protein